MDHSQVLLIQTKYREFKCQKILKQFEAESHDLTEIVKLLCRLTRTPQVVYKLKCFLKKMCSYNNLTITKSFDRLNAIYEIIKFIKEPLVDNNKKILLELWRFEFECIYTFLEDIIKRCVSTVHQTWILDDFIILFNILNQQSFVSYLLTERISKDQMLCKMMETHNYEYSLNMAYLLHPSYLILMIIGVPFTSDKSDFQLLQNIKNFFNICLNPQAVPSSNLIKSYKLWQEELLMFAGNILAYSSNTSSYTACEKIMQLIMKTTIPKVNSSKTFYVDQLKAFSSQFKLVINKYHESFESFVDAFNKKINITQQTIKKPRQVASTTNIFQVRNDHYQYLDHTSNIVVERPAGFAGVTSINLPGIYVNRGLPTTEEAIRGLTPRHFSQLHINSSRDVIDERLLGILEKEREEQHKINKIAEDLRRKCPSNNMPYIRRNKDILKNIICGIQLSKNNWILNTDHMCVILDSFNYALPDLFVNIEQDYLTDIIESSNNKNIMIEFMISKGVVINNQFDRKTQIHQLAKDTKCMSSRIKIALTLLTKNTEKDAKIFMKKFPVTQWNSEELKIIVSDQTFKKNTFIDHSRYQKEI